MDGWLSFLTSIPPPPPMQQNKHVCCFKMIKMRHCQICKTIKHRSGRNNLHVKRVNVSYTMSLKSWKKRQTMAKMVALSNTLAWLWRASGHEMYLGLKNRKTWWSMSSPTKKIVMELWSSIRSHPSQPHFKLPKPQFDLDETRLSISRASGQGKQPRRLGQGSPGPVCRDRLWRVLVISKTV